MISLPTSAGSRNELRARFAPDPASLPQVTVHADAADGLRGAERLVLGEAA